MRVFAVPSPIKIGTDCSGLEAPIWALRALKIPHQQMFASEAARAPTAMIRANTRPGTLYPDVLSKDLTGLPQVDMYVAGFSCKPFSTLHHGTRLLKDPQAAIFFAVARRIAAIRPPCFVLENVCGIRRVLRQVLSVLRRPGYTVQVLLMNPSDLGEPLQRPRVYFLGVRTDMAAAPPRVLQSFADSAWSKAKRPRGPATPLASRLLPAAHPVVQNFLQLRKSMWTAAKRAGFPSKKPSPKWVRLHQRHRQLGSTSTLQTSSVRCTSDDLFLRLPRERGLWDHIRTTYSGPCITADLSQSLGRAPVRADGTVPTITPGSVIAISQAQRILTPAEKILLHALPLHRMRIPQSVSDADLGKMGGNTMHCQVVAAAVVIASSMVKWTATTNWGATASCRQGKCGSSLAAPGPAAFRPTRWSSASRAPMGSRPSKRSPQRRASSKPSLRCGADARSASVRPQKRKWASRWG